MVLCLEPQRQWNWNCKHFPKEINEIHQKLYPVLKEAKKTGQKASFKVDKLVISGQVKRGVETENLVHYGLIMNS